MRIRIQGDSARFIYNDALAGFTKRAGADVDTQRVSHVEPTDNGSGWEATMVNGPVLGPFALREEALAAEAEWLREHKGL